MESLELNKQIFTWLSIYPADKRDVRKAWYRSIAIMIISIEFFGFISSVWFIVENIKTEFEHCLTALSQFAALGSVNYMWTIAMIQQNQIVDVFNKLKDIRDLCKISYFNFKFH